MIYELARTRNALAPTEEAADREVTLPLYPAMEEEQVEWVTRAAQNVLQTMH